MEHDDPGFGDLQEAREHDARVAAKADAEEEAEALHGAWNRACADRQALRTEVKRLREEVMALDTEHARCVGCARRKTPLIVEGHGPECPFDTEVQAPKPGGTPPEGRKWGSDKAAFQHAADEAMYAYLEQAGGQVVDVRDGWRAGVTWLLSVLTGVKDNPLDYVKVGPVPGDPSFDDLDDTHTPEQWARVVKREQQRRKQ